MTTDPTARLLLEDVALAPALAGHRDVLRGGEIVGLAGLDGHGQEAFLETLAGLRRPVSGRVVLIGPGGGAVPVLGYRQAARNGIAYLARDRRSNGIFPTLSVLDNFAVASFRRDTRFGFISARRRAARYALWQARLSIVAPSPQAPITALSGGNQQKVLLARWLAREPRLLLLNDPTRGVDQRTRETLYGVFRDLANEGMTLVILSSEIEEIVRLCDRVLVFREQRMARALDRAAMTRDGVIAAMFGRIA